MSRLETFMFTVFFPGMTTILFTLIHPIFGLLMGAVMARGWYDHIRMRRHFAAWPNATDRPRWFGVWPCECASCRGGERQQIARALTALATPKAEQDGGG